jgi:hypothetical protein
MALPFAAIDGDRFLLRETTLLERCFRYILATAFFAGGLGAILTAPLLQLKAMLAWPDAAMCCGQLWFGLTALFASVYSLCQWPTIVADRGSRSLDVAHAALVRFLDYHLSFQELESVAIEQERHRFGFVYHVVLTRSLSKKSIEIGGNPTREEAIRMAAAVSEVIGVPFTACASERTGGHKG